MTQKIFRISGRVINNKTQLGVAGLRVEAWDKDFIHNDLISSAITDEQGIFRIEFEESYFQIYFLERRPDLFFKVFSENKLIKSTEDSVLWNVEAGDIEICIEVDILEEPEPCPEPEPEPRPEPTPEDNPFIVQGQIQLADSSPFAGATVRAFDKDLRHEQLLGEKTTDKDGNYKITYTARQFRRAEKGSADLIVRVFWSDKVVAESLTIFNAQPVETVNLTVSQDAVGVPSEYEQLLQYLEPLLVDITIEGIPTPTLIDKIADLKPEDIDFLTQETGIKQQQLEFLAKSARLEKQATQQHFNLPTAIFYGLAREELPLDLLALFNRSTQERRTALEQAIQNNIISATLKDSLDRILQELENFVAQYVQQTPPADGKPSVGDLLGTSVLSSEQQATFLKLYANQEGPIEDFWKSLSQQPSFQQPGVVENLQFTLQLGLLTQNHIPLIRALQEAHQPTSTRDLVRMDIPWTELVNQVGVPSDILGTTPQEKTTNYVNGIVGTLQAAFPTETVAKTVAKTPSLNLPVQQAISQFFDNSFNHNLNFDLRTTRIDPFIAQHAATVFDGISESDRSQVVNQVKRIQRLFQVSTSAETATALLSSKFNSAYAIANTPRATFIEQMKTQLGSEQQAQAIYNKAQRVNTTALHVYTKVHQALNDVQPFVLGTSPQAVQEMLLEKSPTLAELFGSLELCDCQDCRSILSPAAYFVDLLHTLENSIPNQNLQSPLDVLLKRRPDIEFIKLNCENTNTLIPYVDLVNEVLESYVVYGQTLPVVTTNAPPPELPLRKIKPNDSSDDVTAEELAANPENTNAAAYDILKEAVYPLTLPYNQSIEVARVYLEHLGSSRYELMQTFQKSGVPSDLDIACEYLKISPEERDVLIGASSKTLRDFYGYSQTDRSPNNQPSLQKNDQGSDVVALQHLLNMAGANPRLVINGKFDDNTQAAVIAFQQGSGSNPDGIVGVTTWTALNAVEEIWLTYLAQVPELLSRTGISYLDLIELVKTHFINPDYSVLAFFQSLKIPYIDLSNWVSSNYTNPPSQAILNALKEAYPDIATEQALQKLREWATENFTKLQKVIDLFAPPDSQCDLSVTAIQYVDGTDLDTNSSDNGPILLDASVGTDTDKVTSSKIHRFIRLWHKLGWSMPELDKTLTAIGATDITSDVLLKLAQIKRLQTELNVPLIQILSFWANIDTWGDDSLYKKLFLSKAALNLDDKFVLAPSGLELLAYTLNQQDPAHNPLPTLSEHVPALLAGLRISESDLNLIRTDTQLTASDAPLNLANISRLYRYTVLAKALKLKIKDLIALKELSGIDLFGTPDFTLQFIDIVQKVRQSGFSIAQLNYLYRHLSEPPTNFEPQHESLLLLAKTLRDGLTKIAEDNVLVSDPMGEVTRTKLATIFEPAIADQTVQMVNGSAVYTTPLDPSLVPATFPDPVKNKISYDRTAKVLKFMGAMTSVEQGLFSGASYKAAINLLFQQPRDFIVNTLTGFLNPSDAITHLLETQSITADGKPDAAAIAQKFAYVLEHLDNTDPTKPQIVGLLPYLRDKLSHTLVKQTLSDALKLDSAIAELLLETVLKSHIDLTQSAVNDALALRTPELTAAYFTTSDLTGLPTIQTVSAIAFDGQATPENQIPASAVSARWTGMLLAPNNETYTFYFQTDGTMRLWVDNQPIADQGNIALKAGQLYNIRVEYVKSGTAALAELSWSSPTTPKNIIPSTNLYPGNIFDTFVATFIRLQKVASLVNSFKLTTQEISYLSEHGADFSNFDFQALPVDRADLQVDQKAVGLFHQWQRLNDFVLLRNSLPQGEVELIDVFGTANAITVSGNHNRLSDALVKQLAATTSQNSGFVSLLALWTGSSEATIKQLAASISQNLSGFTNLLTGLTDLQILDLLLAAATGWDIKELTSLTGAQGFNLAVVDFRNEIALIKLQACMQLIKRLGVSAEKLFNWATQTSDSTQAQDIKNTVKAKYDDETWLTVAKSLSDKLRESQKAALIAYVLTKSDIVAAGVTTSDQLFEYFLIDVEMCACMMTSRIKQAISSVQLFVDRCLMNLEPEVRSDAIDPDVWQWMKHYRVWEANREVFLYPENWIEPELRDNKTPFFKELESELLQNDLTNDTAETAFLNYLEKLDEVARLEICGMYWQDIDPDTQEEVNILHVFGRTFHTRHVYYYRRLENNTNWTPWEKVQVDIEGDHLIPVVWNHRLHIFWLILTEKAVQPKSTSTNNNTSGTDDQAIKSAANDLQVAADTAHQNFGDRDTEVDLLNKAYILLNKLKSEKSSPSSQGTNEPPHKYWEIKLAWSEYKQNKWSAKQISSEFIVARIQPPYDTQLWGRENCVCKARIRNDDLIIQIYLPFFALSLVGEFQFTGCRSKINVVYTKSGYNFSQISEISPKAEYGAEEAYLVSPERSEYTFMTLEERGDLQNGQLKLITGNFGDNPAPDGNALKSQSSITVLNHTPSIYRLLYPHQYPQFVLQAPFFYQDDRHTYFVTPTLGGYCGIACVVLNPSLVRLAPSFYLHEVVTVPEPPILLSTHTEAITSANPDTTVHTSAHHDSPIPTNSVPVTKSAASLPTAVQPFAVTSVADIEVLTVDWANLESKRFQQWFAPTAWQAYSWETYYLKFATHYHPYVCQFIKALNRSGIPGLLSIKNQTPQNSTFYNDYYPTWHVNTPYPNETVDFTTEGTGPYSLYNWELFFHTIMLIATRLTQNQRFEEARKWFHYIFDPTTGSSDSVDKYLTDRYWKLLPFKGVEKDRIDEMLLLLSTDNSKLTPEQQVKKEQLIKQWEELQHHPFQPHLIARLRLIAYQKNVVMKYIDNLIVWGDQLFRQDTIESINEATQLYVLAANILGDRPQRVPERGKVSSETYFTLKGNLDAFSNAIITLENEFPFSSGVSASPNGSDESSGLFGISKTLFFCIPQNDKLLGYWDTVGDRLFKIRHCMNIEGIVRQLPLFEPPIDPALLVRAAAAGVDLNSVLNDLNAPLPNYRFNVMVQKAAELCAEVKALGAAFLSALEKKDAEALALLRSGHEMSVLEAMRDIKQQQIDEANNTLDGLNNYYKVVQARQQYYLNRPRRIPQEDTHEQLLEATIAIQTAQAVLEFIAGGLNLIPEADFGTSGISSPVIKLRFGGSNVAGALQGFSSGLGTTASVLSTAASLVSTQGSYQRRQDDWDNQADLATKELDQVQKQIDAATVRVAIAEKELQNHDLQIDNAKEVDDFMRGKFTNQELYDWMVTQLSTTYFKSYQLVYDTAKKAERAYRFELGLIDSNFIKFGYWDSLKKGLMAGEQLHFDLKRMEIAYLDQYKREYEITRQISLVLHDPLALITLKETERCEVFLPEALFDADYPGHYMRRIKSVSLTIPCVTGPYTSINCTLTLLTNKTRISNNAQADYPEDLENGDSRFVTNFAAMQSIATSTAQNDSGLFEVNFRDERYLPFEGAGVISRWRLEMPKDCNAFDFETISDVIFKLNYTAREGGELLKTAAKNALKDVIKNAEQSRLFSLKHEFPTDWYRFLHPTDQAAQSQSLQLDLMQERFPFLFRGKEITINELDLFLKLIDGVDTQKVKLNVNLSQKDPNNPNKSPTSLADTTFSSSGSPIENLLFRKLESKLKVPTELILSAATVDLASLKEDIEDIWLICNYSVQIS